MAERKEKKKKNLVQNLKWATAHLSRRLGARRVGARLGARASTGLAGGRLATLGRVGRAAAGGTGARGYGGTQAGLTGARARQQARGAPGTQAWARLGRVAGPVGCALGALSLFLARFYSVLFMSRFLDIVREPGS